MARSQAPSGKADFPIGIRELVAMLAFSQALQALAIDSVLPALPDLAADLRVGDPNHRQLVVGLFMIGMGAGALLPGTLADRYGRKPVLLGAILAYTLTGAACALATDFSVLLALRLLGGLLSGGLSAVGSAIVRDRFEGDRMASTQSLIFVVFMVVPMLAPTVGQTVLLVAGWRWIFGMTALLGAGMALWIGLRLPETLAPENRQPISWRRVFGSTGEVLLNRGSIGYVLSSALTMGVMWGYIQSCQQLLGEHFGAGQAFPLVFGGMALSMAVANFTNSRVVMRFGARRTGHAALIVYLLSGCVQFWLAHRGGETLWQFVPVMVVNLICGGFMGANFSSIALQPFARIAGAASSLQLFIRTLLASAMGAVIGQAYDNSARPLSTAIVLAGVGGLALILFSERGRLFRRLNPPGTPPHPEP
ncbi:multidrug effflux MFS transporter [Novosphingobium bradum]|uniref:Multidrug effflux MFS transporter n=1 Tax=Novosphingobium bradum TaxID=1737444 RepID=A0ABV7IRK9_9SPHN